LEDPGKGEGIESLFSLGFPSLSNNKRESFSPDQRENISSKNPFLFGFQRQRTVFKKKRLRILLFLLDEKTKQQKTRQEREGLWSQGKSGHVFRVVDTI